SRSWRCRRGAPGALPDTSRPRLSSLRRLLPPRLRRRPRRRPPPHPRRLPPRSGAVGVPPPPALARYLQNLPPLLETDPGRGREILSRFVAPIILTPEAEGPVRRYRATGAFNLGFFLGAPACRAGKSGCAGRI